MIRVAALACAAIAVSATLAAAAGALFGTSLQQRVTTAALTYGFAALLIGVGLWLVVT